MWILLCTNTWIKVCMYLRWNICRYGGFCRKNPVHLSSSTYIFNWGCTNVFILRYGQKIGFGTRAGTAKVDCVELAVTDRSLRQKFLFFHFEGCQNFGSFHRLEIGWRFFKAPVVRTKITIKVLVKNRAQLFSILSCPITTMLGKNDSNCSTLFRFWSRLKKLRN